MDTTVNVTDVHRVQINSSCTSAHHIHKQSRGAGILSPTFFSQLLRLLETPSHPFHQGQAQPSLTQVSPQGCADCARLHLQVLIPHPHLSGNKYLLNHIILLASKEVASLRINILNSDQ